MEQESEELQGTNRKLVEPGEVPLPFIGEARSLGPMLSNIDWGSFPFYVLVLPGLSAQRLATYLRQNWLALDALTGDNALLLTPMIPNFVSNEYLVWWRQRLSFDDFTLLSKKLAQGLEPGVHDRAEREVYQLIQQIGIPAGKLPAMFITAREESSESFLTTLDHGWDDTTIGQFFEQFADACKRAALENHANKRLARLQSEVKKILHDLDPNHPDALRASIARQVLGQGALAIFQSVLAVLLKIIFGV